MDAKLRQEKIKMWKANLEVLDLQRVAIGSIKLGNLKEGSFRYLLPGEINQLIGFISGKMYTE